MDRQDNRQTGRELLEKRTETAKFFAMGEGRYQALVGDAQIHIRDKQSGRWADVDNRLESGTDARGRRRMESRRNKRLKVWMEAADADWMVRLENEKGKAFAWRLEEPQMRKNAEPVASARENEGQNEAVYADIMPNADMRCCVDGNTFKEDIVFKERRAAKPLSFLVRADGLSLSLLGDRTVEAKDGDELAFVLPPPFMTDDAGETGGVDVALEALGGGKWRLSYTPDAAWLETAAFPVTLDPTVKTTDTSAAAVKRNLVSSAEPGKVFMNATSAKLEDVPASGKQALGFFKFEQAYLPKIDSSYYVTDATLSLTSSTRANTLYLYETLGSWDAETLTYENKPAVREMCSDALVSGAVSTLNITRLVRNWYSGENNGFMLRVKSETPTGNINTTVSGLSLTINYVSLAGLEDYLAYEAHGVGRAGTAHVGLFNGNLVVEHLDTATAGTRMPISVSHYYNSCLSDKDICGAGLGWRHSLAVTLHRETLSGDTIPYYVLTDANGTRHHFKRRTTTAYDDMSGLNLTLTIAGTTATIEDKDNNQMLFDLPTVDSNGSDGKFKLIKSFKNAQEDTIVIAADAQNRVLEAMDGIGRMTRFAYGAEGMLETIFAPGMEERGVQFFYDEAGRLVRILYPDDVESLYEYDAQQNLSCMQTLDKTLSIAYAAESPCRVMSVSAVHGTMQGNRRHYAYGDKMTVVTDGTVENGKSITYHFNDDGSVISSHDMKGLGKFIQYTGATPLHRPAGISKKQGAVVNLLQNGIFETAESWALYNGAKYEKGNQRIGAQCLCFTSMAGDGYQYASQAARLESGKTYTASFEAKRAGDMDVWVSVSYQDALGESRTMRGPSLAGEVFDEYSRACYTFTMPEDAQEGGALLQICAGGAYDGAANIWIDCAQLEAGSAAGQYNLLQNTDFAQADAGGRPTGWMDVGGLSRCSAWADMAEDRRPDCIPEYAVKLAGGIAKASGTYQEIVLGGLKGDAFVAGAWAKGFSLPRGDAKKKYGIRVAFKTSTAFTDYADEVRWGEGWSSWQLACGPVIAPANYTAIRFYLDYQNNENHACFALPFLYKEEFGWSYTYDAKGNVLSVKDPTGKYQYATYDAYNNRIEYQPPGQPTTVKAKLEYGATAAEQKKHLLRKVTSPLKYVQEFAYDVAGNRVSGKLLGTNAKDFVQSEIRYGADKNMAFASVDPRGRIRVQPRNAATGEAVYEAAESGIKKIFSVDMDQNLASTHLSMRDTTARNDYLFTENMLRLKEVRYNREAGDAGVCYGYTYDEMGNVTGTRVGGAPFSAVAYTETGDKLPTQVTFANGGRIRYARDAHKRIVAELNGDAAEPRLRIHYDSLGNASRLEDCALGRELVTMLDASGRYYRLKESENRANVYTETLAYDAYNRVAKRGELVGRTNAYETSYTYDTEGKMLTSTFGKAGAGVAYTYDALGRRSGHTWKGAASNQNGTVAYVEGGYGTGSTTPLIQGISQPSHQHVYLYDEESRIIQETHNGFVTRYAYDALGQLIRVDDANQQKSICYRYDMGQNITQKTEHAYTTAALGEPVRVVGYAYGDENWKDKLTGYDGVSIESDSIGCLLDDGIWRYSWRQGLSLARMECAEDAIDFTYGAGGMRVRKASAAHGTTEYVWSAAALVHMKKGATEMHFWHTGMGRPDMVTYGGKEFYYVYNAQGDVIALLDRSQNCAEAVAYAYDIWGRQISCEGAMKDTLGRDNPFRYRGYLFDEETGLYYLGGRYYNPVWGRFISGSAPSGERNTMLHQNMFAYCGNAPVQFTDPSAILVYGGTFAANAAKAANG